MRFQYYFKCASKFTKKNICIFIFFNLVEKLDTERRTGNISYIEKKVVVFTFSLPCVLGWMDDLRFYVLFNSVSVISGRREVYNERLCAKEFRLMLRRFRLERGSNSVR